MSSLRLAVGGALCGAVALGAWFAIGPRDVCSVPTEITLAPIAGNQAASATGAEPVQAPQPAGEGRVSRADIESREVASLPIESARALIEAGQATSASGAAPIDARQKVQDQVPAGDVAAVDAVQPVASPPSETLGVQLASLGRPDAVSGHAKEGVNAVETRDASDNASNPTPVTQDFRYLIYYVWSELPPPEKPADIVLSSLKDIPVGTPVEEIKRASDAFGLDFTFMKAVAKIESGFDPKQRTGSYIGLFQLSKYEFNKFGSGRILDPRDNAVAAAYKMITEGILFEWVVHKKPTLSDLYLIHQQGWEGAAEHISRPDRIAWKSMCATSEGMEKGEKWCKRAIWRNTVPAVKRAWKSVDKLTSGAFVGMWRERVAHFYSKYMATAAAEPANQISVEWLAGAVASLMPSLAR
jgi:hypothetical protein